VVDIVAQGTDALSGVASLNRTLLSFQRWGDGTAYCDDDDEPDGRQGRGEAAQRRTYTIRDAAGNALVLTAIVRNGGHAVKARVESLRYNGGQTISAPPNRLAVSWAYPPKPKKGWAPIVGLWHINQRLRIRSADIRAHALWTRTPNWTLLQVRDNSRTKPERQDGLLLLQLQTSGGRLRYGGTVQP
jgi:hypothetical protein